MEFSDDHGHTGKHLYQVRVTRTMRSYESAYITVAADSRDDAVNLVTDMDSDGDLSDKLDFECDDSEWDEIEYGDDVEVDEPRERLQFERLIGDSDRGNSF